MKKKDITHPKLYCDFKIKPQGLELFYYSNQLDQKGNRIMDSFVDSKINSFSDSDLNQLNKKEYNKLLSYILRQERVMQTYLKKGFHSHYEIVKSSLALMYKFKNHFESVVKDES